MSTTKLAHATQKAAGIPNGLRTATVASVSTTGITLSINGAEVGPFACLDTMLPVVGDVVSVFRQDSTWIIIGRPTLNPSPWFTPALANGWTGILSMRIVRGEGLSLQITGELVPGTKADNTTVCTLTAPYVPLTAKDVAISCNPTAAAGGQSPHFAFRGTGVVSCFGVSAATSVGFQATIALDI